MINMICEAAMIEASRRSRLQFSLRAVLLLLTVIAVLVGSWTLPERARNERRAYDRLARALSTLNLQSSPVPLAIENDGGGIARSDDVYEFHLDLRLKSSRAVSLEALDALIDDLVRRAKELGCQIMRDTPSDTEFSQDVNPRDYIRIGSRQFAYRSGAAHGAIRLRIFALDRSRLVVELYFEHVQVR